MTHFSSDIKGQSNCKLLSLPVAISLPVYHYVVFSLWAGWQGAGSPPVTHSRGNWGSVVGMLGGANHKLGCRGVCYLPPSVLGSPGPLARCWQRMHSGSSHLGPQSGGRTPGAWPCGSTALLEEWLAVWAGNRFLGSPCACRDLSGEHSLLALFPVPLAPGGAFGTSYRWDVPNLFNGCSRCQGARKGPVG